MDVIFATKNPAKVKKYKEELEKNGINLLTINDLDIDIPIDENGKDCLENAYIKAKTYFDTTGRPSIGMDNSLFIEELPADKQPGTHVRRINGKELTDDEMIEYYSGLVKEYGGRLTAKWVYGMVICDKNGKKEFTWSKDEFYFVDKINEKRNVGYPLDSMSIDKKLNKYFVDLTKEDREFLDKEKKKSDIDVINFLIENLK